MIIFPQHTGRRFLSNLSSSRLGRWLRNELGVVLLVILGCGLAAIGCGGGTSTPPNNNISPADVGLTIQGCPADIQAVATSPTGVAVTFSGYSAVYDTTKVITGNSLYPLTLTINVSKPSGTIFNLGPTVVTITATLDGYTTNQVAFTAVTTCSFTVTVGLGPNSCAPPAVSSLPPGYYPIGTCGQAGLSSIPLNATPVEAVQGCDGNIYCKSAVFPGTGPTDTGHPECALSWFSPDGFSGNTFSVSDALNGGMYYGPIVQMKVPGANTNIFFICNENGGITNAGSIVSFGDLGSNLHTVRAFAGTTLDINNHIVPDLKLPIGLAADGFGRAWVVAKGGGANNAGGIASIFWNGSAYKLMYSFTASQYPMYSPVTLVVNGKLTVCVSVLNLATGLHSILFIDADTGTSGLVPVTTSSANPPNDSRCSPLLVNGELYVWNGPRSSVGTSNNPCRLFKVALPVGVTPGSSTLIATLPPGQDQTVVNSAVGPDNRVYVIVSDAAGSLQDMNTTPLNGSAAISVFPMSAGSFPVHDTLNFSSFVPDTAADACAALIPTQDGSVMVFGSVQFTGDIFAISPDTLWPAANEPPVATVGPPDSPSEPPGPASPLPDVVTGGTYHPMASLTVPTNFIGQNVARGLALNGDIMLLGVPYSSDTNYQGMVHVFRRDTTNWNLESTLSPPMTDNTALFGFAVAMNQDTAVVGAPGAINATNRAGAAYVFRLAGTNWTQEARLTNSASRPGDEFGAAVAIYVDSIIAGATGATNGGDHAGRGYIYQRTNSSWPQKAILAPPGAAAQDYFGGAVAIRGTNALVGAPRSDGFKQTYKPGAAYWFRYTGTIWTAGTALTNLSPYGADLFGASVAVGDGFFAVGAPGLNPMDPADPFAYRRGVHVFMTNIDSVTLAPASPVLLEMFGTSISLDGSRITVGAPRAIETNSPATIGGAGYVFDYRGGAWYQSARLVPEDPQAGDLFGLGVAASSDWIGVSAIIHSSSNGLVGAAYAFNVTQLPAPVMSITPVPPQLRLDWSPGFAGYVLEDNPGLGPLNWTAVNPAPSTNSYIFVPGGGIRYFRLRQP